MADQLGIIDYILISNQFIMIIVFGVLWYLSNSASDQIRGAISQFKTPCIPTGKNGNVGWTQSITGSLSTCDLSHNSTSDTVNKLLNGMSSLDLSGNVQSISSGLVGLGVISSLILMFAPFSIDILEGLKKIITFFKLKLEHAPQGGGPESPDRPHMDADQGGGGADNFIEQYIEKFPLFILSIDSSGNNKCDTEDDENNGNIIRFFIGFVQILFLLIFSDLISGNSLKITTMLFSVLISLTLIFMILTKLPYMIKINENLKLLLTVVAIILGLVFILLKIFFNKNMSIITQIFSASCLVLSLSLGVYSVSDTDCPKKTIGCLISNYCEVINKSSGFGIAKIILIILGIIFLPNYNNNSITKMIEESYGIPKTIFISIVMLFIVVYTLIPGYSLLKGLEGHKDEAANNFYDKARCIGD